MTWTNTTPGTMLMIKPADIVNNPWTVIGALLVGAWWMVQHKQEFPDIWEPVVVSELDARMIPVEASAKTSDDNWARRNIPWAWRKICGPDAWPYESQRSYLNEQYELYRSANNGQRHEYDGDTAAQVCASKDWK